MNKQIIRQVKFYTNKEQTKTIAFLPYGRYFVFTANNSGITSLDLAVSTLFFKASVNVQNATLTAFNSSLENTALIAA